MKDRNGKPPATSFRLTKESKRILKDARARGTLMHTVVNEGIELWALYHLKKQAAA